MVVYITDKSLWVMAAQAVEQYRREAYGCVLISKKRKDFVIDGVITYATAKHTGTMEVLHSSKSKNAFSWISRLTTVNDGWHSHPYKQNRWLNAEPSDDDIEQTTMGHFDIIVALKKVKTKQPIQWSPRKKGLAARIDGYQFELRCWRRVGALRSVEYPLRILAK